MDHTTHDDSPARARRARHRRTALPALVGAAVALAAVLAPSTASAATSTGTAAGPSGAHGVPDGFAPVSTSWTSPSRGWVLGFAPCPAGSCPVLLGTRDGARTWKRQRAPQVADTPNQTRIDFADRHDGFATDGSILSSSHNGGHTWRQVTLPGTSGRISIIAMATNDMFVYVVAAQGSGDTASTGLYSSPVGEDRWRAVPGVRIPGRGGWDVTAHGSSGYVSLGRVFRSTRFWSTSDGRHWTERAPMCSPNAAVRVSTVTPGDVRALCSVDPHGGEMVKFLVGSTDGGAPAVLGRAPDSGVTRGFVSTATGAAFVGAVGDGGSWLYGSFDNGATWQRQVVILGAELPMRELSFSDPQHGVAVWGGPSWRNAAVFRTTDGGHTWKPLIF